VSRLEVTTDNIVSDPGKELEIISPGYRLRIIDEEGMWLITSAKYGDLVFARMQDAEAAKAALEREGLTTCKAMCAAGFTRVKQIIAEAMAW